MTVRKYLCQIVGSGGGEDPFRPIIADFPTIKWSATIVCHEDGSPSVDECIVNIDAEDFTLIDEVAIRIE